MRPKPETVEAHSCQTRYGKLLDVHIDHSLNAYCPKCNKMLLDSQCSHKVMAILNSRRQNKADERGRR